MEDALIDKLNSMKSSYLTVQQKDLIKGLVVAVLTAFLTSVGVALEDMALPTAKEFKDCGLAALGAGIAYIIKNFLTNNNDQLLKKDV
jgi:hypothetical protein